MAAGKEEVQSQERWLALWEWLIAQGKDEQICDCVEHRDSVPKICGAPAAYKGEGLEARELRCALHRLRQYRYSTLDKYLETVRCVHFSLNSAGEAENPAEDVAVTVRFREDVAVTVITTGFRRGAGVFTNREAALLGLVSATEQICRTLTESCAKPLPAAVEMLVACYALAGANYNVD